MGAAASSGSDTTDLAASVESWVTSGGAAAIAALEAASPALAAALRSADADAVRGALAAPAATEDGAEANAADSEAPTTKRLKPSENSGAAFVRVVLEKDGNASKVLNFAGYRTVLRLEAVCKPAWTALRAGKLELDVSKEKNLSVAVRHAARHEILDARRQGYFPKAYSVTWRYSSSGVQQSTSDVLYHDDSVFLTSPRPRQLFRAVSGLDTRDKERSKASLAAFECSKASLLAVGCVLVDVDHRRGDIDAVKLRRSFANTFDAEAGVKGSAEVSKKVDEAGSSKLIEAMGASRAIPRRLVLLTERPNENLQNDILAYLKIYRLYSPVIQKFLSAGAPLNDRTENGLTALHITVYDALTVKDNLDPAIYRNNIRTLVLAGADLLAKTTAPATAEDVVLANGAPIPAGLTPMDVARTCGLRSRRDAVVAELTAAIAERAL